MPVSDPSYLPPQSASDQIRGINAGRNSVGAPLLLMGQAAGNNSTVNGLIIIGHLAGSAGITDATLAETLIIGNGSAAALVSRSALYPGSTPGAVTIVGSGNVPLVTGIDTSVIFGANNLPVAIAGSNITRSIIIGNNNLPAADSSVNYVDLIIIGNQNFLTATEVDQSQSLVMIGSLNAPSGAISNMSNSQVIGHGISFTGVNSENVLIGDSVQLGQTLGQNVVVGWAAESLQSTGTNTGHNVVLGAASIAYGDLNTLLGYHTGGVPAAALGCVFIGANAGTDAAASNVLIIASSTAIGGGAGNAPSALVVGDFLAGNLVLGGSVQGTNRDLQGTNTVKLVNGTKAGNPVGGGYFYVNAGALHWVGSAGTDTPLAVA